MTFFYQPPLVIPKIETGESEAHNAAYIEASTPKPDLQPMVSIVFQHQLKQMMAGDKKWTKCNIERKGLCKIGALQK